MGRQSGSSMMKMWSLFSGKGSGVSESIQHYLVVLVYSVACVSRIQWNPSDTNGTKESVKLPYFHKFILYCMQGLLEPY